VGNVAVMALWRLVCRALKLGGAKNIVN
jgi:hypothetical protein